MKFFSFVAAVGLLWTDLGLAANYSCENEEVVAAVQSKIRCVVSSCQFYGLDDFQFSELNEDLVIQKQNETRARDQSSAPRLHATRNYRDFYEEYRRRDKELFQLAPKLVVRITGHTIDYNPRIGRYECEADLSYDAQVARRIWANVLFAQMLGEPDIQRALLLPEGTSIVNLTYRQLVKEAGLPKLQSRLRFAVQPSAAPGKRFSVDAPDVKIFLP